MIEVEQAEIGPLNPHETTAHELISNVGDFLVKTNNLFVDLRAVDSGLAAEDNEYRLAGPLRFRLGGSVVAIPAELVRAAFALSKGD